MTLASNQPYFMPYIGFFQEINAVDRFILYDHLPFIRHGWVNRNRIAIRGQYERGIVVPLKNKSSNRTITETCIDYSQPWQRQMLRMLVANYARSPFFKETFPMVEEILSSDHTTIAQLNDDSIIRICRHLGIETEIVSNEGRHSQLEERLARFEGTDYSDFPEYEELHTARKVIRIIEMLRMEGCERFLNAIGGTALYSKDEFRHYGIDLSFIRTNPITYPHISREFIPNLSIIDVMMQVGRDETRKLLDEYTIV